LLSSIVTPEFFNVELTPPCHLGMAFVVPVGAAKPSSILTIEVHPYQEPF
jgi:hypothetical protein